MPSSPKAHAQYMRSWRRQHRQEQSVWWKKYRGRNPGLVKSCNLRRYGISLAEYVRMFEAQDGRCAICGSKMLQGGTPGTKTQSAHVDHDHATGKVRALLCGPCNGGLGYFHDDPLLVQLALQYLRRYEGAGNPPVPE